MLQNGGAYYHEADGTRTVAEADGVEASGKGKHEIDGAGIQEAEARETKRVFEIDGTSAQPRR